MNKENRKSTILINGAVGFICQVVFLIMQFLIHIVTLEYIGVEVVGISSTISSVLKTLSLTELGFQTTVVFYLYVPLAEQNYDKINKILKILKCFYMAVGSIFIILSIVTVPFLKYVLKDVEITGVVIIYYLLMSTNNACTYYIAYKRALLFADQKEYISKLVDSFTNIIINIVMIVVIIIAKNYIIVLFLQIIQTISSNLIIQQLCKKRYFYLKSYEFDKNLFGSIIKDVKNVFLGRIAGYVYSATDNLVISSVIGATYVGYLTNYTIFTIALKILINSVFNAMTPVIGNLLAAKGRPIEEETNFRVYSYVRYLVASIIVIPWILFASDIVSAFFGSQYILSDAIVVLLAADLYIHTVYSACWEYINGSGKFKLDKNISVIGAIINIVASIYFVYKFGVEGVLIGTVISQMFFWIGRSAIVYFSVFQMNMRNMGKYAIKNILWLVLLISEIILFKYLKIVIRIENFYVSIFITLTLFETANILIQYILLHFTEEQIGLINFFKKIRL